MEHIYQQIYQDDAFQNMVKQKTRLGWALTISMIVIYFGFILLVSLEPDFLKRSLNGGVTTIGIPIGIGVILSAIALCGIYVWRANRVFDKLNRAIVEQYEPK